ncbi:hypothetical protein [Agromyces aerolatus]|uniref:hypothetical protein n=1 Tax=Agromyces sp. LY-1074 TaxID=3074080 RepID=UPI0028590ED8|nr:MULTISPECIES: hypothetical protein [unclassified Agromyces]MDR5701427.1 hypothetical protein [Agromyces sp. LY-1074]MDR5706784.1 hypothetical protein [Agromyces sp. LY-1358]
MALGPTPVPGASAASIQSTPEPVDDCVAKVSVLQVGPQRYDVQVSAMCSSLAPATPVDVRDCGCRAAGTREL